MSQPQSSSGCNYAQAMADQTPRYDNQVRKTKRVCGTCGKKPCVCKKKK